MMQHLEQYEQWDKITDQLITKEMKVFKGLSLTDQKIMFENLFIWDIENGDIPNRKDYKKWVLAFFESQKHINNYISDLEFDIELSDGDAYLSSTNESYKRQINFLNQLKTKTP